MNRFFHTLLTMTLLLSVNTLFAQRNGRVEGVVKDTASGERLPHTNVALVGSSLGTFTLEDGSYTISNVLPGSYTLSLSRVTRNEFYLLFF